MANNNDNNTQHHNNSNNQHQNRGQNASSGSGTSNRGFAGMDSDRQRDIASKGGQASSGNFAHDRARASEAGKRGAESRAESRGNRQHSSDRSRSSDDDNS